MSHSLSQAELSWASLVKRDLTTYCEIEVMNSFSYAEREKARDKLRRTNFSIENADLLQTIDLCAEKWFYHTLYEKDAKLAFDSFKNCLSKTSKLLLDREIKICYLRKKYNEQVEALKRGQRQAQRMQQNKTISYVPNKEILER